VAPLVVLAGAFALGYASDVALQYFTNGRRLDCIDNKGALLSGALSSIPITRAVYVLRAKAIPKLASNARDAYNRRADLKRQFRFGLHRPIERFRPSKPFAEIIDPLSSSGNTNFTANITAIGGGAALASVSILNNKDCSCN